MVSQDRSVYQERHARISSWPGDRTSTKRPNTFAQTCLSSHTFTLQFDGGPYISDGPPKRVSSALALLRTNQPNWNLATQANTSYRNTRQCFASGSTADLQCHVFRAPVILWGAPLGDANIFSRCKGEAGEYPVFVSCVPVKM